MRRNLPSPEFFIGQTIDRFPNHEIQEHIASGNNGHSFRAFNKSTESNLAFKVVPLSNLPKDENEQYVYLNEAKKANVLQHPSVIRIVDIVPYREIDECESCVVFVSDYVQGQNLRDYMRQHRSEISVPFVETYLRAMFELLFELRQRGFQHGDLHAGNVLVANSEYDIYGRPTFRITDFGVRVLTGQVAHASDYLNVAQTLRTLLEAVRYSDCEGLDRYVYNVLKQDFLSRHLTEIDISVDPLACKSSRHDGEAGFVAGSISKREGTTSIRS